MRRLILTMIAVVAVLAAAGTVAAQPAQRFPDVPPDHEAYEAIEWAAEAGLTAGYDDGTFKPERPLSKRHAVVFVERYYDKILGADQSEDFTRGDMMWVLMALNDDQSQRVADLQRQVERLRSELIYAQQHGFVRSCVQLGDRSEWRQSTGATCQLHERGCHALRADGTCERWSPWVGQCQWQLLNTSWLSRSQIRQLNEQADGCVG